MVITNIISRRFILAGAVLASAMVFVPVKVTLAQEAAQPIPRPGEKNDAGIVNVPTSYAYPDLTSCVEKLRDPSIYKGSKRRILKQIEPGLDGWIFRTADFRSDFTMPDKTFDYMVAVKDALKAKGVDLYLVIQPPRAMLMHEHINPAYMPEDYDASVAKANYKYLIKKLNKAGIRAADLSDIPSDLVYFFKGDPHWRREGAQWSAEKVSSLIRENEQYKDIAKEEFSIEITWWLEDEKGEFDEFVEGICGVVIPPERRPMWATTSKNAVSEASLFGDITYADVAIVGTSNTAHEEDFNFVGSLKKALKVDIRNKAMSAGGFSGAAHTFFGTDEFQNHPPKILIWEFLSHHQFDDYAGFRQMLPAIEGGCSNEEALFASDNLEINIPDAEIDELQSVMHEFIFMDYLEDKHVRALDSYLELNVVEPENRRLQVSVLYANGDADTIDVSRSRRAKNEGKYFIDFNDDIDEELMLIQIETDKPLGKIEAKLCSKNKNI